MFEDGKKSTIDELNTKYKREPSLGKSIYVEGTTDRDLIKWFLKKSSINEVYVYEIGTVNIPKNQVESLGFEDNNRGRVLTITNLVTYGIIGIIDSDFDFLHKTNYTKKDYLFSTDYSAMEMYLYNQNTFEKIFMLYADKQPKNYDEFMHYFGNILNEIFLIRFAKEQLYKSMSHENFDKQLKLVNNKIEFERDKYLIKYVKNKLAIAQEFNTFIDRIRPTLPTDIRKFIHGHDFLELLKFYLDIKHDKKYFDKLLYSSFEYDILKEEKMFQNLIKYLK